MYPKSYKSIIAFHRIKYDFGKNCSFAVKNGLYDYRCPFLMIIYGPHPRIVFGQHSILKYFENICDPTHYAWKSDTGTVSSIDRDCLMLEPNKIRNFDFLVVSDKSKYR